MSCQEQNLINLDFDLILGRIIEATGLKNRAQVADSIKIKEQAINNYKNKKKWPVVTLYKLSVVHGLSLDWLLTGRGSIRMEARLEAPNVGERRALYASLNEKYPEVIALVREILQSGDGLVIKALREKLQDFSAMIETNREHRKEQERIERIEAAIERLEKGSTEPGGASPAGIEAPPEDDPTSGGADLKKRAM